MQLTPLRRYLTTAPRRLLRTLTPLTRPVRKPIHPTLPKRNFTVLSTNEKKVDPLNPNLTGSPDVYFGVNAFDKVTMQKYLLASDWDKYVSCISNRQQIDIELADSIAAAMLKWAKERGVTHFTHWFQPITGTCAEKHDGFIDTTRDQTPIIRFTGKQLIMGEPDGSSFPSGGLRMTHRARGYTCWDATSTPFILRNEHGATLYIPSLFFSWKNDLALDEKIPLLRSEVALEHQVLNFFKVIGQSEHNSCHVDAGLEQEFFLINREYYLQRPDLMLTGRTVVGAKGAKGQELEDQYFGAISARVLEFMHEFERECWALGICIQTRHREVAPGQYEFANKYCAANIGTDRNLLMMELLRKIAQKHGLAALLHEKPFAGVNGSGKHNNWSLGTNLIPSLFSPGKQGAFNPIFMFFLAATIRAVHIHSDLMRVAISGVGNDHRLGANEAPPAIVSVYLGDDVESSVARYLSNDRTPVHQDTKIRLGVNAVPDLHRVPTDRNRTSTFAFTGNKFEFRAVGASQNPSRSSQVLNTIVADSVRHMTAELQKLLETGKTVDEALRKVTTETLIKHKNVVFNGNGYSEEWQQEARKRGLPNLKSTPTALDTYISPKNIELFSSLGVLNETELTARANIKFEEYVKKICIEAKVMRRIVKQQVVPAALDYQSELLHNVTELKNLGVDATEQEKLLRQLTQLINSLLSNAGKLHTLSEAAHNPSFSLSQAAHHCEDEVFKQMEITRIDCDALEEMVPEASWPLPSYHEMLFNQD